MAEASEAMLGFATTNGGSADLEIVVYCPVWSLVRRAATHSGTLAGRHRRMGRLCRRDGVPS